VKYYIFLKNDMIVPFLVLVHQKGLPGKLPTTG